MLGTIFLNFARMAIHRRCVYTRCEHDTTCGIQNFFGAGDVSRVTVRFFQRARPNVQFRFAMQRL